MSKRTWRYIDRRTEHQRGAFFTIAIRSTFLEQVECSLNDYRNYLNDQIAFEQFLESRQIPFPTSLVDVQLRYWEGLQILQRQRMADYQNLTLVQKNLELENIRQFDEILHSRQQVEHQIRLEGEVLDLSVDGKRDQQEHLDHQMLERQLDQRLELFANQNPDLVRQMEAYAEDLSKHSRRVPQREPTQEISSSDSEISVGHPPTIPTPTPSPPMNLSPLRCKASEYEDAIGTSTSGLEYFKNNVAYAILLYAVERVRKLNREKKSRSGRWVIEMPEARRKRLEQKRLELKRQQAEIGARSVTVETVAKQALTDAPKVEQGDQHAPQPSTSYAFKQPSTSHAPLQRSISYGHQQPSTSYGSQQPSTPHVSLQPSTSYGHQQPSTLYYRQLSTSEQDISYLSDESSGETDEDVLSTTEFLKFDPPPKNEPKRSHPDHRVKCECDDCIEYVRQKRYHDREHARYLVRMQSFLDANIFAIEKDLQLRETKAREESSRLEERSRNFRANNLKYGERQYSTLPTRSRRGRYAVHVAQMALAGLCGWSPGESATDDRSSGRDLANLVEPCDTPVYFPPPFALNPSQPELAVLKTQQGYIYHAQQTPEGYLSPKQLESNATIQYWQQADLHRSLFYYKKRMSLPLKMSTSMFASAEARERWFEQVLGFAQSDAPLQMQAFIPMGSSRQPQPEPQQASPQKQQSHLRQPQPESVQISPQQQRQRQSKQQPQPEPQQASPQKQQSQLRQPQPGQQPQQISPQQQQQYELQHQQPAALSRQVSSQPRKPGLSLEQISPQPRPQLPGSSPSQQRQQRLLQRQQSQRRLEPPLQQASPEQQQQLPQPQSEPQRVSPQRRQVQQPDPSLQLVSPQQRQQSVHRPHHSPQEPRPGQVKEIQQMLEMQQQRVQLQQMVAGASIQESQVQPAQMPPLQQRGQLSEVISGLVQRQLALYQQHLRPPLPTSCRPQQPPQQQPQLMWPAGQQQPQSPPYRPQRFPPQSQLSSETLSSPKRKHVASTERQIQQSASSYAQQPQPSTSFQLQQPEISPLRKQRSPQQLPQASQQHQQPAPSYQAQDYQLAQHEDEPLALVVYQEPRYSLQMTSVASQPPARPEARPEITDSRRIQGVAVQAGALDMEAMSQQIAFLTKQVAARDRELEELREMNRRILSDGRQVQREEAKTPQPKDPSSDQELSL